MKNLSYGELINEAAFCKALKKSDNLHWTIAESGRDIVINGHWIIDAQLSEKARSALFAVFGRVPEVGIWYHALKCGSRYSVNETTPIQYEKFFESCGDFTACDTRLTYRLADGRTVAIYTTRTDAERVETYLDNAYAEMIASRECGLSQGKPYSGIAFTRSGERAFILPVRVTDDPFAFLNK